MGTYEYQGSISKSAVFDYFPYPVTEPMLARSASEFLEELKPGCEEWRVIMELSALGAAAEILYRPLAA
ncbi:MAG: hypothetical protein NC180_06385 [Muribaculaceae bacterium]|nr:hypothetical protein [Muribaculaceae bacterium]MCM1492835.1 hypothetical protein [Muribaculaceae bacterium]